MKNRHFSHLCSGIFVIFCAAMFILCSCNDTKSKKETHKSSKQMRDTKSKKETRKTSKTVSLDISKVTINQFKTHYVTLHNIGDDMPGGSYFIQFFSHGTDHEAHHKKYDEIRSFSALKKNNCGEYILGEGALAPNTFRIDLTVHQSKEKVFSGVFHTHTNPNYRKMVIDSEKPIKLSIKDPIKDYYKKTNGNLAINLTNVGEDLPESSEYYVVITSYSKEGYKHDEIRILEPALYKKDGLQHFELGASEIVKGELSKLEFDVYAVQKIFSKSFDIRAKKEYIFTN